MRIVAPTYFQTPNDLVDFWLPQLGEAEVKILLVIFRKTFGWHKDKDKISLSQFQKLTGLTRTNCCKAIESLVSKGVIIKEINGKLGTEECFYEIAVDDSNNSDQSFCDTPPSPVAGPPLVPQKDPQKKTAKEISKQQQPAAAGAVFFDCLRDVDIHEKEKIIISKKYSEDIAARAINYATHPSTIIKTTLIQTIKWACENHPQIPLSKEEIINTNISLAITISKICIHPNFKIDPCSKHVEIIHKTGQQLAVIAYSENGFKEQLMNAIRKAKG